MSNDHMTEADLERVAARILAELPTVTVNRLEAESIRLGVAIAMTPTGPKRNKLTEANIHLVAAIQAVKEASC